jgi:hypothetical protein
MDQQEELLLEQQLKAQEMLVMEELVAQVAEEELWLVDKFKFQQMVCL